MSRTFPGFGISAQPTSLDVAKGASGSYAVTLVPVNGFAGDVTYTVVGLPVGATATASAVTNGTKISIAVANEVAPSTYPLKIVARSGTLEATIAVNLLVTTTAA